MLLFLDLQDAIISFLPMWDSNWDWIGWKLLLKCSSLILLIITYIKNEFNVLEKKLKNIPLLKNLHCAFQTIFNSKSSIYKQSVPLSGIQASTLESWCHQVTFLELIQ